MPKTRRTVVIDWQDNDVTDSDELQVWAESDEEAMSAAKRKWRSDIGFQWPGCRIVKAFVVSAKDEI